MSEDGTSDTGEERGHEGACLALPSPFALGGTGQAAHAVAQTWMSVPGKEEGSSREVKGVRAQRVR
jgi:hypothetical protein